MWIRARVVVLGLGAETVRVCGFGVQGFAVSGLELCDCVVSGRGVAILVRWLGVWRVG